MPFDIPKLCADTLDAIAENNTDTAWNIAEFVFLEGVLGGDEEEDKEETSDGGRECGEGG